MSYPGSYEYNEAEGYGHCHHGYPVGNCDACKAPTPSTWEERLVTVTVRVSSRDAADARDSVDAVFHEFNRTPGSQIIGWHLEDED